LDIAVGFHLLEAAVAHPVSSSPWGMSSECFEHGNLKEKEVEEKQGNLREMPGSLRRGTGR
jgi:hypothetical protein